MANKTDLESSRQVSTRVAQEFAEKNGLLYVETSAKTGRNVNEVGRRIFPILDSVDNLQRKTFQNNCSH